MKIKGFTLGATGQFPRGQADTTADSTLAYGSVHPWCGVPCDPCARVARFLRLFKAVPLNDIEQLPDPDYGR